MIGGRIVLYRSIMTSTGQVNLLDLAASALAATVAAARPIRDLSSVGGEKNARLKDDGSVVTDADFSAQGAIMRTIQQVSGHVRIVGEESEEEMLRHLGEDDECQQVYQLARQEVLMRYHNLEGRPPLSGDSEISPPVDVDEPDSPDVIVDADRVSVFVDPLDGTKSYARADYQSVTILIAIILDSAPCFGVICKPFGCNDTPSILDTGFVAIYGGTLLNGVYVAGGNKCHKPLRTEGELPRAVISKSRSEGIVRDFVDELAANQVIHPEPLHVTGAGEKSLRLVMGTENEALWFFPKAGTSLWDVAASDALLRQLGGKLTDKYGRELDYSKSREDAGNDDGIIACNDEALHAECIKVFQGRTWTRR
jgi:3'-phosphoadenosine 5'-phosphosulfate (PAPS) 3'-phosphatase